MIEFRLWGVVVDESLRLLDGSYWLNSKATDAKEILESWEEQFPGSNVRLIELGHHKKYVRKTE